MQPYRDRLRSLLLLPPLLLLGMGDCTLVSVDLSIVRPDADGDGEVTAADQAVLAGCEGLDPGSVPACALADGDRDGDVDAADAAAVDAALGERVCNGFVELCDRPLDQVAFATAHNAYSAVDDGFRLGPTANHFQGIAEQLPAGVRGLMLDVLRWEDPFDPDDAEQLWLCHGVCDLGTFALGAIPLVDGLATIRDFLEARPGEVVVLLFEIVDPADEAIPKQGPDIGEDEVEAAFAEAGLLPAPGTGLRPHVHTPGQPWATLAELVDADERLVVLTQDRQDVPGSVPWYHYLWDDLAWDTPFTPAAPTTSAAAAAAAARATTSSS